jgi:hypothetical protein
MSTLITDFLAGIKVGGVQFFQNMAVLSLLTEQETPVDFITLDEALALEALTITEIDESGSVPQLKVVNKSGNRILLVDGEEVVGAKQNRVLNVTILLAPDSETLIPVSCIEQGRWSYTNRKFSSADRSMNADLRKKKTQSVHNCLRESGSFASDQGEIWEEIDLKFARLRERPSPTRALSDLYESKQGTTAEYHRHFSPVEKQIGMAVFLNGALAGIEFLSKYDKFRQLYGKVVTSYILDALENAEIEESPTSQSSEAEIGSFLKAAEQAALERRASVALGEDLRLSAENLIGAGLSMTDQVLQLSLFPTRESHKRHGQETRFRRASRRRNNLTG